MRTASLEIADAERFMPKDKEASGDSEMILKACFVLHVNGT